MNKKFLNVLLVLLIAITCMSSGIFGLLATAADYTANESVSTTQAELKITTQPKSVSVKSGQTATVKIAAKGQGLSYKWYYKNPGDSEFTLSTSMKSSTYTVEMSKSRSGRQLYCVVTDKAGNKVKSSTVTIKMTASKAIVTTQPESVSAKNGQTATVKVYAAGPDLTYKWYYKDKGDTKFTLSKTMKSATYTAEMNSTRDGRQLYCVVTDKNGSKAKTETVTIKLKTPITTQPKSVTVKSGEIATVKLTAKGEGLTYKWYYRNPGDKEFTLSKTMTGSAYTVEMTRSRNGRELYCVVIDKAGNKTKSSVVTIKMSASKATITKQPTSVAVEGGKTATVKVYAAGSGLTYKWYFKDKGDTKFTLSKTMKSAAYSAEMNSTRNGRQLYCVITDKNGNKVKTSTVTIQMKATITKQPKSTSVKSGQIATVKITAKGEGLSYRWYYKNPGDTEFTRSTTMKGSTYTVEMSKSRNGRQLYCVVVDKNGNKTKSNVVTLKITASKATITKQPTSVSVKRGNDATVSVYAAGPGLTYKWYFKDKGADKYTLSTTMKGSTYSAEMNGSRHGRQLYCVITDKNGNKVKTNTVTIKMKSQVTITTQPLPVTAQSGSSVTFKIAAVGEGLTYKWYYKNAGDTKFTLSPSVKTSKYVVEMSSARDGRQVYCVVTDKYGAKAKSDVVKMAMGMPITITLQPESVTAEEGKTAVVMVGAVGEGIKYKWYYRNAGDTEFTATSTFTGGVYTTEMNSKRDGREIYCLITDKNGASVKTDTVTLTMAPAYEITVDLGYGEPLVVGVGKDGKYSLEKPTRPGYGFQGWKTAAGVDFASSGTITRDVTVKAEWKLASTDTLAKLISRTNGGATEILIAGNITVDRPIYISHDVTIYSDKNYTIKRAPGYNGDIFVVGKDEDGISSLLHHRKAVLTLGGGKGTLTIDGNRGKTTVDVVGSLVFAGDSSTVNIKDGVRLCNNLKVGNERMNTYDESSSEDTIIRAGGAAILNNNSVVNMYGGVIDNNEVKTEHTIIVDELGVETKKETAGCGGAIYNNGSFLMYGGTIKNNEALRGGAIYTAKPLTVEAGTIQGNRSHTYGGAISTSASMYANVYIGSEAGGNTLLIKDNYSISAGGALYSNTTSPIIVLGNTVFEGNVSDYSGGAIYTAGSLTVRNSTFRGNSTVYSGGAIFFHNSKDSEWIPRRAEITGCTFEANKASLGGAITFSRSNKADPEATGVVTTITDCKFYKNEAIKNDANPGNGGAIYVTQLADATIKGSEFKGNVAASSGGAVSINGQADAKLSDLTFTDNTAGNGGAIYLSIDTTSKLKNITLTGNKAVLSETGSNGNGGAIYAYSAATTFSNLDVRGNSAEKNGGGIYLTATTLTLGADTKVENNSALGHGGAFYLTYLTKEDGTKTGAKLTLDSMEIVNNSALAGGAISVRTDCEATVKNTTLTGNSATALSEDAAGGGAIYVGFGKLTVADSTLSGNSSAYYGGAVHSVGSTVNMTNSTVTESTGTTGAAIYIYSKSTASLKNVTVKNNTAKSNGSVYVNGSSLTMDNVTATGNSATNGGVLYLSGSSTTATLKNSTWKGNSATNGGTIYMTSGSATITGCSFQENTAKLGGAIYSKSARLTTTNVSFKDNSASSNGGAVYVADGNYTSLAKDSFAGNSAANHGGAIYVSYVDVETEEETYRSGGILNVMGGSFTGNSAVGGGAVSARTDCEASFKNTTFTDNKSIGNDGKADGYGEGGGAVYVGYGKLTLTGVTAKNNSSETFGGAVHLLDSKSTVSNSTFTENSAMDGGAIWAKVGGTFTSTNNSFQSNRASGNAGAVYLGSGVTATLKSLTFTNNHADSNAGALYVADAAITTEALDMQGNSAGSNGGAIYLQAREMSVTSADVFKNNSAGGHGGAIYLTYKTNDDKSTTGATLNATDVVFEANSAMAGGAISARTGCTVNLNGTSLLNNSVTGFSGENDGDGEGGGAIYVGYGKLNMTDVTAKGNTATDFGGVIDAVKSPVTITGGTYSENTSNRGGMIHAMSGCAVTVSGAEISGNKSLDPNADYNTELGGGAFNTSGGSLHITASTLSGNSADYYGGTILSNKTAVTIDGETVITGSTGGTGAALHMRSGKVVLENISVTDNVASANGVIYYAGSDLTMDNVTATGNKASSGGVLFASVASTSVTIKNSSFTDNSATNGGAIYSKGANVTLNDSSMSENTATYGGAVYASDNSNVSLSGMSFLKNSVAKDGGAVYVKASTVTAADAEGSVNSFTENSAANHGGAIYVVYATNEADQTKTPGVLSVTGGTFTGNSAIGGGAVSARTDCEASFDGTTFTSNKSVGNDGKADGYGEGGGAVYVGYGKLNMTGITAEGNSSETYGGTVQILDSEATLADSTLKESSAANGGAIYSIGGGSLSATGVVFDSNSASGNAGAVYLGSGVTATLKSLTFTNNHADSNAGALYVADAAITTEALDMQGNSAGSNGGAVYLQAREMSVTSADVFKNNSAGGHGGAIYLTYKTNDDKSTTGATLNATDVVFEANSAMAGGAISARTGCTVNLNGTSLLNNSVTGFNNENDGDGEGGGAIYVGYGKLNMTDVTAKGNTATDFGGVIDAVKSPVTITGGTYSENTSNRGGVIHAMSGCAVTVSGAEISGNKSLDPNADYNTELGGGAFNTSDGSLHITASTLSGNSAGYYGGTILSNKTEVTIDGETVITGSTGGTGAALHMRSGKVVLENISVTDNVASANGVIYYAGSDITVDNVTATGNKASSGGVLFASVASTNVTIKNSSFTDNSATSGGAIYSKGASVTIKDSSFENNTGSYGSAIYNEQGNLTTEGVTFSGNDAVLTASGSGGNGGAVFLAGGTYTASDTDLFTGNTAVGHAGAIYVSYFTDNTTNDKLGGTLTVPAATFTGNSAAAGGAVSIRTNGNATFTGTTFTGNSATSDSGNDGGGAIYVGYGKLTLDGTTMKENSTGFYGGAVSVIGATLEAKNNAVFENNHGSTGLAIQIREASTVALTDVTLKDHVAVERGNGTVYITGSGSLEMTRVTATGNLNGNGGVIYASSTSKVSVTDSSLTGNTATGNGGAIDFRSTGKLSIANSTISNNSATNGGAIYVSSTGTVSITDSEISDNSATSGGAIYLDKCSASITGGSLERNEARLGGAVYNNLCTLTTDGTAFNENKATFNATGAQGNGGAILINGGTLTGSATFDKNSADSHAGAIYVTYVKGTNGAANTNGSVSLTNSTFTDNSALAGGAVSVRSSCSATFEDTVFTGNTVSGYVDAGDEDPTDDNDGDGEGGGAIYVGYGSVTLNNVTATGNTATDSFGGFLDSVQGTVAINGGTYTGNSAVAGGAIHSIYKSKITVTNANISENESTFANPDKDGNYNNNMGGGAVAITEGSITLSGVTMDGNVSSYYGGTILSNGATVSITNGSTVSGSIGKTGAAIYLQGGGKTTIDSSSITGNVKSTTGTIYINNGTLEMNNVTASGNKATNGSVVYASGTSAKVIITGGTYTENSASSGGAIFNNKANVTVNGATMSQNTATLGGALYNSEGTLTVTDSTFTGNTATKSGTSGGNGGAIYVSGGKLNASGTNKFEGNSAANHGGAIYNSYVTGSDGSKNGGVVTMTDGLFKSNSATSGGAISSRTACSVELTGTKLEGNSASDSASSTGGGAIYCNDGSLALSGVTFDGNSSAYYGGAVFASNSTASVEDSTVVKSSTGTTGAALYFHTCTTTIDTISVTGNTASGNGVLYATAGTLTMTNVTASDNTSYNGGVLFVSGAAQVTINGGKFTDNVATNNGGVISQSCKSLTINGGEFTGNSAKLGGVIYTSSASTISGSLIEGNSSTSKGGAVYATGTSAVVTIKDSSMLNSNTATYGGAIFLDLGATVSITNSTLDGNEATTGEGGAIMVADSTETNPQAKTKLEMTGVTLSNNKAKTRGGALATDGASPKLIIDAKSCSFIGNSAPTSGGAICIQNASCNSATDPSEVTVVFKDCSFSGNSSDIGGAIDVRTGSCIKIDGITATGNTATSNAGVIYVTSNNSRLYLTGTVTLKDNVAKSGTFAYLYKTTSYTNPPKVYTTHSNTADWYASVTGNKTNVVFDLTTLP